MKVGVIGGGVVGAATAHAFGGYVDEVRIWDRMPERRTVRDPIRAAECDLVFVCLPEAEVAGWFGGVHPQMRSQNYVLRSTVPVGTTRRLFYEERFTQLVHNPEFVTERTALTDALLPARLLIGYPAHPSGGFGNVCGSTLHRLYERRFPGVPVFAMTSDESETVKLADNAWGAVKVAWFNELSALCASLGLNWRTVRSALLAGGRISHSHTQVPGPDGSFGFGGRCLPKDAQAFVDLIKDVGLHPSVTAGALVRNEWDRGRLS